MLERERTATPVRAFTVRLVRVDRDHPEIDELATSG